MFGLRGCAAHFPATHKQPDTVLPDPRYAHTHAAARAAWRATPTHVHNLRTTRARGRCGRPKPQNILAHFCFFVCPSTRSQGHATGRASRARPAPARPGHAHGGLHTVVRGARRASRASRASPDAPNAHTLTHCVRARPAALCGQCFGPASCWAGRAQPCADSASPLPEAGAGREPACPRLVIRCL